MNDLDMGTTLFGVSSPQHWFGEDLETAELSRGLKKTAAERKRRNPIRFLFAASLPSRTFPCCWRSWPRWRR